MANNGANLLSRLKARVVRAPRPRVRRLWRRSVRRLTVTSEVGRRTALDLFFPPACASCGCDLEAFDGRLLFCSACQEAMSLYVEPTCRRCGAAMPASVNKCPHCRDLSCRFDEACALGPYDGLLRELVLRMKKSSGEHLSLAIGELCWARLASRLASAGFDVVTAVPMHPLRRIVRRTNSPSLVAGVLARRLGVAWAEGLLRRRRNTPPQSTMPPSRRIQNLRGALAVGAGYYLAGARVLLVDDIMTTGATCNEASRVLRSAGAERVTVLVVARATA